MFERGIPKSTLEQVLQEFYKILIIKFFLHMKGSLIKFVDEDELSFKNIIPYFKNPIERTNY